MVFGLWGTLSLTQVRDVIVKYGVAGDDDDDNDDGDDDDDDDENSVLASLCSKQKRILLVGKEESRLQWKKDYKIAIQRRLRQICQIHFT